MNTFSPKRRKILLQLLERDRKKGSLDKEMIPFLDRINQFPFILTNDSCSGHGIRNPYLSLQSALNADETINKILRPFQKEWESKPYVNRIPIHLILPYECLYILELDKEKWRRQLKLFIKILERVKKRNLAGLNMKKIWKTLFYYEMICVRCSRKFYCNKKKWTKDQTLKTCLERKVCICDKCGKEQGLKYECEV